MADEPRRVFPVTFTGQDDETLKDFTPRPIPIDVEELPKGDSAAEPATSDTSNTEKKAPPLPPRLAKSAPVPSESTTP